MYHWTQSLFAYGGACLVAIVTCAAHGKLTAVGSKHSDYVVFLKIAVYGNHSHRQQAACLRRHQRVVGALVDAYLAFGEAVAVGNPFLHARHAAAFCHKLCAGHICAVKKKVGKHVLALAVGDIDGDALVGDFACRAEFGAHATAPERGARLPYYGIDIHPGAQIG